MAACQELYDDCASTDVASTLLLIPAYLIAITAGLFIAGSGGGDSGCGGGDLGDGLSCKASRKECLKSCPMDSGNYYSPAYPPSYAPSPYAPSPYAPGGGGR